MFVGELISGIVIILWRDSRKCLNERHLELRVESFFFFSFLVFTKVETLCYPSVFLVLFVYEKANADSKFICLGKSEKKDYFRVKMLIKSMFCSFLLKHFVNGI